MPKKRQIKTLNINDPVMAKVMANQIVMKPKWYFVLGSFLMMTGLVATSIIGVFLTNLTIFMLRQHGPMGQWRLEQLLGSFPLWVPVVALLGIVAGIFFLKKYDFSYKNNFLLIILGFVLSIIITAFLLDLTGLDNLWMKQGPMRRFRNQNNYQNITKPTILKSL